MKTPVERFYKWYKKQPPKEVLKWFENNIIFPIVSAHVHCEGKYRKALEIIKYGYNHEGKRPGVHIGYEGAKEIAAKALE